MSKDSIEKIEGTDPASQSADLIAENIEKLKTLFPEIVTEGKVDFDVLQEILGEEVETGEEYYRFTWAGKAQARREAHKPSTGTLRPCKEESVNWDDTQNLYIEGDNLEVLKLLQKSYTGKVKMIYIDPPYNTGKDFVYKDNYKDNLRNYQELTGQRDEAGHSLSTNSDSDGRYHSNWLNMMYPRLRLARNLLREDGVIFISIDDTEVANLRELGNEVFGSDNFIANVIWEKKYTVANDAKYFSDNHDHILLYCKKRDSFSIGRLPRTQEMNSAYKNPDEHPKGPWKATPLQAKSGTDSNFTHTFPNNVAWSPPVGRYSAYSHSKLDELFDNGEIWFGVDGNATPSRKTFLSELKNKGVVPRTILNYKEAGHNHEAILEIKEFFDGNIFDTPKPTRLVRVLSRIAPLQTNETLLDFFSGSATTAHAVMQLNAEDGGQRRHIQVQLPEPTAEKSEARKAGYETIAEIGKERIRRAGVKIIGELDDRIIGLEGKKELSDEEQKELEELKERKEKLDIGFKVFKLDSSNIQAWDGDPEKLQENLLSAAENIKPERTEEDVLYEILLKYGLDLSLPITERSIEGQRVYNVGLGAIFCCLGDQIPASVAEGIGAWYEEIWQGSPNEERTPARVIFKDSGLTDVVKTNVMQGLKRFGITEVRSV